jgi:iron(III) transport system substrate-binding protein
MRKRHTLLLIACTLFLAACGSRETNAVVVYTALDQEFSKPLLDAYAANGETEVKPRYDTEASKTIGLVNAIRAESRRPRCDVFWNNEIVNTLRLRKEGLLAPVAIPNGAAYPAQFRDPEGYWYGFAARARVILVNTELVPKEKFPRGLQDAIDPHWRGRVAMAKPLFGSTATHFAVLHAHWGEKDYESWLNGLKTNEVQIHPGNRQSAAAVAAGTAAFGFTDTDDAMLEIAAGAPVRIIYPDSEPGQLGTLFIPNTLSVLRDAPNPEQAAALIDHLLAPETEAELANGPSAQIPLHPDTTAESRVATPRSVHAMSPDWEAAADAFEAAARLAETILLNE